MTLNSNQFRNLITSVLTPAARASRNSAPRERAFALASACISGQTLNANNTRAQHKTMACTDSVSDVNNALHKADDEEAPVITLEYGPYMN